MDDSDAVRRESRTDREVEMQRLIQAEVIVLLPQDKCIKAGGGRGATKGSCSA